MVSSVCLNLDVTIWHRFSFVFRFSKKALSVGRGDPAQVLGSEMIVKSLFAVTAIILGLNSPVGIWCQNEVV